MNRFARRTCSIAIAACFCAVPSSAQSPGDVSGRFQAPDGLDVRLWAESPQLFNPTAMDVDARGRVWVTEAVNYRKWNGRNPGRSHAAGDRVVILEDTDGDGAADTSKVFVQDTELVAPLGITVLGERVIVACSPNIFVYTDADGDDVPERREVFLTGFGGHDHDHGAHSLVVGPDGRYYGNVGNAGPHLVTDKGGFRLRSGSLYSGGGAQGADNKPALVSDDGRVWTGGLVYRVNPDGGDFTVLAHNFRNNYEVALDSYGNLFQSDNDDDGNASCRTMWVMEGGNYGFFSADGSRSWQADRRPGQSTRAAHWHQDDPGVAPSGSINGAGGPTGVTVYEGELLARWIDGAVLNADAGAGVVYAHHPKARGAGFDLESSIFLAPHPDSSAEAPHLFRPSDVVVGTDGAVYVADWFDPGVGGHLARDREAYGRILRIAPQGNRPQAPKLDLATTQGQIAALASPAVHVRALGFAALARGAEEAQNALLAFADDDGPGDTAERIRVRALWPLAHSDSGRAVLERGLAHPDATWRITAVRALRGVDPAATLRHADALSKDPSAAVRRELMLALRDVPLADCAEVLVRLAAGYDGEDRNYLEAFGIAADGKEEALYPLLAAELGDTPSQWDARFAGLAWRLHPVAAIDAFAARALDESLQPEERAQALTALAFIRDKRAGEAVLGIALAGPPDAQVLARWWIAHRDTNDWRAYRLAHQLGGTDLGDAEERFTSGVMRDGIVDVDVDVAGADTLWLVVEDGGNGNACDWAAWIEPRFVGERDEVRVTKANFVQAEAGWGLVNANRDSMGEELTVGGQSFAWGIGTHARSVIEVRVPGGAKRFVARAGPEDSGVGQTQCEDSIEFKVFVARPVRRDDLFAFEATVLDADASEADKAKAVRALAADPEGGLVLIHLAARDALAPPLFETAEEAIFKNPDVTVRALASEHFQRPDAETLLPPVATLAEMRGDGRGAAVFFGEKAQCATCHVFRGRGGDVGPDLTDVRKKLDRMALLDAILNPSAAITHGYDTTLVRTKDGLLYTGFVLAEGEDVVLKDTQGRRHVIHADEIEVRGVQRFSTMPEGVALGLDASELVGVVDLLQEDPDAPVVFGETIHLFDGQSLTGWTHHLADEDTPPDSVWTALGGVLSCEGRPIGYLRTDASYTNYELTLEWRFDPARGPGNSGVLLRMVGEDKVWPKSIEAQLHHRNAGDIWNIDRFPMEVEPSRTNGRRTAKSQPSSELPLGEWNRYVITLNGGTLTLEVNGVVQNTATWCEEVPGKICLQSEGAAIQFRNIRLRPIIR